MKLQLQEKLKAEVLDTNIRSPYHVNLEKTFLMVLKCPVWYNPQKPQLKGFVERYQDMIFKNTNDHFLIGISIIISVIYICHI